MQKFFSNRRLVILVVILVVCFSLMAGSVALRNRRSTPPLIQQFGDDVVGIAGSVVTYPANIIQGGLSNVNELMNTYSENKELKQQVTELAQVKVRDQTLAKENKQLKAELKVKSSLTDYSTIAASVLSRDPSSWQAQLVINFPMSKFRTVIDTLRTLGAWSAGFLKLTRPTVLLSCLVILVNHRTALPLRFKVLTVRRLTGSSLATTRQPTS